MDTSGQKFIHACLKRLRPIAFNQYGYAAFDVLEMRCQERLADCNLDDATRAKVFRQRGHQGLQKCGKVWGDAWSVQQLSQQIWRSCGTEDETNGAVERLKWRV